jgi:low affinity Fe/Cu permease
MQVTLCQKLDLIPAIVSIWLTIVYAALTGPFQRRAKTWYLHICYAALRKATRRLTPLQMQ